MLCLCTPANLLYRGIVHLYMKKVGLDRSRTKSYRVGLSSEYSGTLLLSPWGPMVRPERGVFLELLCTFEKKMRSFIGGIYFLIEYPNSNESFFFLFFFLICLNALFQQVSYGHLNDVFMACNKHKVQSSPSNAGSLLFFFFIYRWR